MPKNNDPTNEIGVEAKITNSGLSLQAKSRALGMVDALIGGLGSAWLAKLQNEANRIRAKGQVEEAVYEAAADAVRASTGEDSEIGHLIEAVALSKIQGMVNKVHVVDHAAESLALEDSRALNNPETAREVNEEDLDWLNYFGSYAEKARSEDLRVLWGRILAGEIRQRGSFSLMTLRVMAEIDPETAKMFEEETKHRVMNDSILRPDEIKGERLRKLTHLEQVGLLHSVAPASGLGWTISPDPDGYAMFHEANLCLRLKLNGDANLKAIPLTRVGREVASLLPPVDAMVVLKRVAERFRGSARSMVIYSVRRELDGSKILDPLEVLKPERRGN